MIFPFHYHTRHIPAEHLKFTTPCGRQVARNGLPYILDPGHIENLKTFGIDTVELRLTWWELEKSPGVFDWSRFDRDINRVEKSGLKAGLMAWFHHPPSWYRGTFFRCVTHGYETTTLSPWAPETLAAMDRLYRLTAERYGGRIDFVYVTGSGDYGEPVFPQGVDHYLFSSPHSHEGIDWTGDPFARRAWKKISPIPPEEVIYTDDRKLSLRYVDFVANATSDYIAACYRMIRTYFPHARYGVPIGHLAEAAVGQNRSLVIRKMAQISPDFTARWTGMACLGEFGRSNVTANRISSAARFYGAAFGEEAALILEGNNAANARYESIANGCSMLHNDYGNIVRSGETNNAAAREMLCEDPVSDVALLWPDIEEAIDAVKQLGHGGKSRLINDFIELAADLRKRINYDTCDSVMIRDGFLKKYKTLVLLSPVPPELADEIAAFEARGGVVTDGTEFPVPPEKIYRTIHTRHVSEYNPATCQITIAPNPGSERRP